VSIERISWRSLEGALATALAALLLLLPANQLTFLTTTLFGAEEHSHLFSSVAVLWAQGWPVLAMGICLFVIVLPPIRFGLLVYVLAKLRFGRVEPHLGRLFRWSNSLQTWAMVDVFLLAFLVAYSRIAATVTVAIGPGAVCFLGAGLLTLLTRAALDKRAVWRLIGPETPPPPGAPAISCGGCDLVLPGAMAGRSCPRCAAPLRARHADGVGRASALSLAALIFYAPANILPFASIPINLNPTPYTIIGGVHDLIEAHLWGLAFLVFLASFLIPIAKLFGLAWFVHSVLARSTRRLVLKTRVYQLVDEMGRWSMVDPLTVACFVPVVRFNALLTAKAEAAAPFFAGVVVLTILAAKAFDPRLMWDAAGRAG
jgi:paraquat-inducible protein A